ncbi:putative MFS family arabinose efflux permease [Stenotrophomonas rhizophila]|uniref:MFS transporter n=1 Tax=Stenotrophomonas TaxID=40323 RepID=UPI000F4BB01B|nr:MULTISPECIES: MFS transporter [Stenotrophomonas]MCW6028250.1 MFS transporter [Stenotrophomonas sp. SRS1]ROP76827.1 putative MFS family arabinose efflux permease [Stenotrophomonas rhizophila]
MWRLTALLAGVALLLTGSGLLGTLLAVRGGEAGFGAGTLGLVMSGYFAGFFIGTFFAPSLIGRIGHIRAFAFFAALAAIAVLVHPLWINPVGWGVLRIITGIALVGLYTVIESWLNAEPDPRLRSRAFSLYMVVNLSALALGQVLLMLGDAGATSMFMLTAILVCAAVLPVTATRLRPPEIPSVPRLKLARLYAMAPVATVAAGLSGLAMGAFWGLLPVYAGEIGLDGNGVALFMLTAIAGGALLQWPLGHISDGHDRRTGLVALSLAAAGIAVVASLPMIQVQTHLVFGLFFFYGGLAFALYPFAVAHMLDYLPREDLLSGCSSLLLVHGVGAALGPALAGAAMQRFGAPALPLYFAVVLMLLALFTTARLLSFQRLRTHPVGFRLMLRTTPSALELMPETDTAPPDPDTPLPSDSDKEVH